MVILHKRTFNIKKLIKPGWFFVRLLTYILIAMLAFSIYNRFPLLFSSSDIEVPVQSYLSTASTTSTPVQLIIPKLGLKTSVIPVGITREGNMDVPNSLKDVGWYKHGPVPGEVGNAVIDGHEVDTLGLGAVFRNLHLLKKGDLIFTKDNEGNLISFSVDRVEVYRYDEAPLQEIFGTTSERKLNLITCEGNFIQRIGTKDRRLVVYSTRI